MSLTDPDISNDTESHHEMQASGQADTLDAIILGAGITGLVASYTLQSRGKKTIILEKAGRVGGPIGTIKEQGFLVEKGPNSLLLPDPWVEELIDDLGLMPQFVDSRPEAKKRYIVRDNRPVAVPMSPLQAISTPLFSLKAKFGFLAEPFRKRISQEAAQAESVASFVRRRMGPEFLDYAINPFVSGVYAGDPEELVLKHAFPLMRGFERDGGSIIRGAMQLKKKRKLEGTTYKKRSISFKDGLEVLPQRLAQRIGNSLQLKSEVRYIEKLDTLWRVVWNNESGKHEQIAKKLIIALPGNAIKELPWPFEIDTYLSKTPDLPYPAVHSLALGFRHEQIAHPLDGFGVLVPTKEPPNILGTLFSSSLYDGRAPEGHCLLTVMIGGRQRPDLAEKTQSELVEIAMSDLSGLLGIKGGPCFESLTSWPRAIPQYTRDFTRWSQTLHRLEKEQPGLHFGGHAIDGIAMGACIMSGKRLGETA